MLAASLWSVAGGILTWRASQWLGVDHLLFWILAFGLGSVKSLYLLDKTAKKTIARNLFLKNDSCLGAVYSVKTWLLVGGMIGAGIFLRRSSLPVVLLGCLYGAIGWALLFSSRLLWLAWYETE